MIIINGIGKSIDGLNGTPNTHIVIWHKDLKTYGDGYQLFGKTVIGMTITFLKF
jgi:hypothetical protein